MGRVKQKHIGAVGARLDNVARDLYRLETRVRSEARIGVELYDDLVEAKESQASRVSGLELSVQMHGDRLAALEQRNVIDEEDSDWPGASVAVVGSICRLLGVSVLDDPSDLGMHVERLKDRLDALLDACIKWHDFEADDANQADRDLACYLAKVRKEVGR